MKFGHLLLLALVNLSSVAFGLKGPFLENQSLAFQEAVKSKRPLLIDFYGIWCPPCNELDETVFETEGFLAKAKSFVLLKVDADAKASWKIKDRYKVGGYPTLIFTSEKGDEIYRVVGYRSQKEMVRIMDMVLKAKSMDFKKACESKNTADLMRCATSCAERKEIKCATAAYEKIQPQIAKGSSEYQIANAFFLEQEKMLELKRNMYEKLLLENPAVPYAMVWATEYLASFDDEKFAKPKPELVETVLKNYPKISVSKDLDPLGLTKTDIAQMRAELLSRIGRSIEAKNAWNEAASLFESAAREVTKGASARGFTIERIGCLEQAGELDAALALAEEYSAKYPTEFTFHFWQASLLYRAKRYLDATPAAYKAFDVSYGDNKIRAATLLIDVLATIPDKTTAKKVYEAVKIDIQPEAKLEVRTHRYLKRLEESYKKAAG